jgi:hypothetical protein
MVTAVKRPAGETRGKVAAGPDAGQRHRASPRPYAILTCPVAPVQIIPFVAYGERHVNEQAAVQAGLRGSPQGSGQITEREGKRPASGGQTAGPGCA